MKYLIVGLGNPGLEYARTRHNIGFEVLDYLAQANSLSFEDKRYGALTLLKHKGRSFYLLKPSTYMNLSGKALDYWMKQEKIELNQILVLTDDLNLQFGQVRLKGKGSSGGHNGLKHIEEVLGHQNYARLRIGIGSEFSKGQQVDYVLGEWSAAEKEKMPKILEHCAKAVLSFGLAGLELTMSQCNKTLNFD